MNNTLSEIDNKFLKERYEKFSPIYEKIKVKLDSFDKDMLYQFLLWTQAEAQCRVELNGAKFWDSEYNFEDYNYGFKTPMSTIELLEFLDTIL